jgi:hypothetical protein
VSLEVVREVSGSLKEVFLDEIRFRFVRREIFIEYFTETSDWIFFRQLPGISYSIVDIRVDSDLVMWLSILNPKCKYCRSKIYSF